MDLERAGYTAHDAAPVACDDRGPELAPGSCAATGARAAVQVAVARTLDELAALQAWSAWHVLLLTRARAGRDRQRRAARHDEQALSRIELREGPRLVAVNGCLSSGASLVDST